MNVFLNQSTLQSLKTIRGFFFDPFHGGIHRYIDGYGNIIGLYGDDEKESGKLYSNKIVYCDKYTFNNSPIAKARIDQKRPHPHFQKMMLCNQSTNKLFLVIDFYEKTHVDHHRYYIAFYDIAKEKIFWEDSNVWSKGIFQSTSTFDFFQNKQSVLQLKQPSFISTKSPLQFKKNSNQIPIVNPVKSHRKWKRNRNK